MADADRKPVVGIDPQYLLTAQVVERPPAERPKHETIDTILDWLADPARQMPLLVSGLRPAFRFCDDPPCSHAAPAIPRRQPSLGGAPPVKPWPHSLPMRLSNCCAMRPARCGGHHGRETLRRASMSLEASSISRSFMTSRQRTYRLLCVAGQRSFGTNRMVTYVADRGGGLTPQEISNLTRVSQRLPLLVDAYLQRRLGPRIVFNADRARRPCPLLLCSARFCPQA
ncbi:MAG: hypothetical protein K2Y27_02890 [Xanthobacteraceae bacterium]|nr:hypothetical protein [Xanthobacteraceae bacterium]